MSSNMAERVPRETNRFLSGDGVSTAFTPGELRLATTGKNPRATMVDRAITHGSPLDPDPAGGRVGGVSDDSEGVLNAAAPERWVAEEKSAVTDYPRAQLAPDPGVIEPLRALSARFTPAAVSSSATARLAACFEVTDLAPPFPEGRRSSAEDALSVPTSKPDPAICTFAVAAPGINPQQGLAIEGSVPGAQAAVAAHVRTVGNVPFVPEGERAARIAARQQAGVIGIVS